MPEYLEIILRASGTFYFLLFVARLLGKTQISQLTYFDYITGITLGTMAATLAFNPQDKLIIPAVIGISVWAIHKKLVDWLALNNIPARKVLTGESVVVIKNGKLMENAMARAHYNLEDLMIQLRNLKIFDLSRVEEAVFETNGRLSVLLKSQYQPATPKDLNISTSYQGMPQIVLVDGNVAHHRLKEIGLTEAWLKEELKKLGITDLSEVVAAQLNTNGQLYVDRRSDWEGWKTD